MNGAGINILITAGPTREPLDPVRFLSNRSTGRMGYALAKAAVMHKHNVTLISGPVSLEPPKGARVVRVMTAAQMCAAVEEELPSCDVLVMVAAVADWRPRKVSKKKLKKTEMSSTIELERTEDILAKIRLVKGDRLVIGFAAETDDLAHEAERKRNEKDLDLIVANNIADPESGFEVPTNQVMLLHRDGQTEQLPLMSKDDVAMHLLQWIESKQALKQTQIP